MTRPAELQVREPLFQLPGRRSVKVVERFERPGPHFRAQIGLVPDFPVLDVVAVSVPFPFRIVADDVRHDVDPFARVGGRVGEIFVAAVLDRRTEAVVYLRAAFDAIADVVVGLIEIIVAGIVRVGMEVGEYQRNVDYPHARVFQRRVVQPGDRDVQPRERFADVAAGHLLVHQRRGQIAAVQFLDRPGRAVGEYPDARLCNAGPTVPVRSCRCGTGRRGEQDAYQQAHAVFRCSRLHFILCSGYCSPKRASVSKILKISVSVKKLRRGPAGRRFLPAGKWVRNCRVSDAEG